MHNSYKDIMDIAGSVHGPQWWDENGAPRFAPHHPSLCPDIYANEVALLRIACQQCRQKYDVQMSWSSIRWVNEAQTRLFMKELEAKGEQKLPFIIAEMIKNKSIHYGDPPNMMHADEDCAGPSMNCDDLRVIEYWRREAFEWERMPKFEGGIDE